MNRRHFVAIMTLCAFLMLLHGLKLQSFWGDPARWLFETYRGTSEVVYRDFAWPYPPLGALIMSGAFRLFGATFLTAQIVLDGLSLVIVLLMWAFARRLLSARLAFLTTIAATSALTGIAGFALFAIDTYTPAQLTGMIGWLLLLIVLIDQVRDGHWTWSRWLAVSVGSTIGLWSKPEVALGVIVTLGVLIAIERGRALVKVLMLGFGPASIGYLLLGAITGYDNLFDGIGAYGANTFTCSWWPTGIALFGVIAALGLGAFGVALLSLPRFKVLQRLRSKYLLSWSVGGLGVLMSAVYLPLAMNRAGWQSVTLTDVWNYVTSAGTLTLPVMWWSIGVAAWLIALRVRKKQVPGEWREWLLIGTLGGAMSVRSLFGDSFSIVALITLAALPLWLIVGPYWLLKILSRLDAAYAWERVVVVSVCVWAGVWVLNDVVTQVTRPYQRLETLAGPVYVADDGVSANVYQYVIEHTHDDAPVLDVIYGGGVNFAARRGSPIYITQFVHHNPPERLVSADLDRIAAQPPALVIGNDQPRFGSSFGLIAPTRCPFPRLVWRPDQLANDPARSFPALEYVAEHYQPAAQFGDVVVFQPEQ